MLRQNFLHQIADLPASSAREVEPNRNCGKNAQPLTSGNGIKIYGLGSRDGNLAPCR
jgi:hypothetical protein